MPTTFATKPLSENAEAVQSLPKETGGGQRMFRNADPAFIDFGCGDGASLRLAEAICGAPGGGVGLDVSAEKVAAAGRDGFDVAQGDVLDFEGRGVAPASFAVDVMPELEGRAAFEKACVNVVRAARDYAVIQHQNFDSAEVLAARGLVVPGHTDKRVRMRPRAMDYLHFVMQYGSRLDIVGFAAFGFGEPKTKAAPVTGLSGSLLAPGAQARAHRPQGGGAVSDSAGSGRDGRNVDDVEGGSLVPCRR
jgi:hypothetical protein